MRFISHLLCNIDMILHISFGPDILFFSRTAPPFLSPSAFSHHRFNKLCTAAAAQNGTEDRYITKRVASSAAPMKQDRQPFKSYAIKETGTQKGSEGEAAWNRDRKKNDEATS